MKNYLNSKEDSNTFILNYTIYDDSILIRFANSEILESIPYTAGNEQKILEKMREQVLNSEEYEKELKITR